MRRLRPVAHDDQLSVIDHLDELRSRLLVSLAALGVAFALTAWQSDLVLAILNAPLPDGSAGYAAVLLALPVLLYQAYAFLLPALSPRERRAALTPTSSTPSCERRTTTRSPSC